MTKSINKIAIRGGHNENSTGSSGYIDELTENRKVYPYVITYLKRLGYQVIDVTPPPSDVNSDLKYGVVIANNENCDLFVSIHFNSFIKESANGTECIVYNDKSISNTIANNICSQLGKHFYNRGVKYNNELYELKNTMMPSIIVEICFVSNEKDSNKYKLVGADEIGKLIAYGISNLTISNDKQTVNVKYNITDNEIKLIFDDNIKINVVQ